MKLSIIQSITSLCAIGFLLFLGQLLSPWYAELTGEAEREIQAKLNAEACASYTLLYINKRLYCQCSDTEKQKPNKCNEKYK